MTEDLTQMPMQYDIFLTGTSETLDILVIRNCESCLGYSSEVLCSSKYTDNIYLFFALTYTL